VACIAAEDTRHSGSLLQHFDIKTPTLALHDHNEREKGAMILGRIKAGESIALISDAGTPLISDPGYVLVQAAREEGITVSPIPGACALIAALSAAGLPTDRFIFEGFLSAKSEARKTRLKALAEESRTLIFYEAPHRVLDLLEDLVTVFGAERTVVVARELTKRFETIHSGAASEVLQWAKADSNQQRGEFVILVKGFLQATEEALAEVVPLLKILLAELPLKQAVDLASKITQQKKNAIYDLALQLKQ
jgi:16S rRNA (cytidine1402-2'-O)-methyltransferase